LSITTARLGFQQAVRRFLQIILLWQVAAAVVLMVVLAVVAQVDY
jgi:hypothetical protein